MARILHYCQYNVGLGHLARTRGIVAPLLARHEVTLVLGGDPVADFPLPPGIRRIQLEPIMRRADGSLAGRDGRRDLGTIRARRREQLIAAVEAVRPECLMIEMFPFCKRAFREELLALLTAARRHDARVVCSLRDLFHVRPAESASAAWIEDTLADLREHFDLLLYHSDPELVPLEDCFPAIDRIPCPWHYTGLVAPPPPAHRPRTPGPPRIVGSVGGGAHGVALLTALIGASRRLAQPHALDVFCGAFMAPADRRRLASLAAGADHVRVRPLAESLVDELAAADLSVSLCGYNTALDILRARVRALVLPSPSRQFREQHERARRLAARGVVGLLDDEDVEAGRLGDRIAAALATGPVVPDLDLDGAAKSAAAIDALLADRPAAGRLAPAAVRERA